MFTRFFKTAPYLLMLAAALSGCQKQSTAKEQFQLESEAVITNLTNSYSRGFKKTTSGRGVAGDWSSSVAPWGQGPYGGRLYYPQVDVRARNCFEMLRSIPKTRDNYGPVMIQATKCFNSILGERHPVLTYGFNNGNDNYQNNFAFNGAWPQWGGRENWGSSQFQVFQSVLPYGYSLGQ